MEQKVKILLCGDVEGKFEALFKRVETINNKSGPFDLLLCVGNFFGVNNKQFLPYILGEKKVPISTYILGPNKQDHVSDYPQNETDFELCTNVYYLGKRGIYTDSKGLKIAYISGVYSADKQETWNYNEKEITELCDVALKGNPSFRGVDILLSSQWPAGIFDNSKKGFSITQESDYISYLCLKLKPRYIVSGLEGIYYERPPFRCPNLKETESSMEIVTRFIGLARVGNSNKDKWIYALNVTPLDKMKITELIQKTTDETPCPFGFNELENKLFRGVKRKTASPNQYFYDMNAPMEDNKRKKRGNKPKIEFDQSKCWFCLFSPTVEKHLVITVGECCYLALAKGGMVEEHFLICPIEHFQNSLSATDAIRNEIKQFKDAIRQFYDRNGQVPVFFERNYKTSHMQVQAVPIPSQAATELKDIFIDESDAQGFRLESLDSHSRLEQVLSPKTLYFTVELPNDEVLYTKIQSSMNFPLNFGREVLSLGPILNMPERADYKECLMNKGDEETIASRIRTDFEPFDFTT